MRISLAQADVPGRVVVASVLCVGEEPTGLSVSYPNNGSVRPDVSYPRQSAVRRQSELFASITSSAIQGVSVESAIRCVGVGNPYSRPSDQMPLGRTFSACRLDILCCSACASTQCIGIDFRVSNVTVDDPDRRAVRPDSPGHGVGGIQGKLLRCVACAGGHRVSVYSDVTKSSFVTHIVVPSDQMPLGQ